MSIVSAWGWPPTLPALRAEDELLLLCSRASIDFAGVVRIQELLQTPIDWNVFLLAACRNHVLGLVSHRLQATCADAIPAPNLEFLCDCSRKTAERNHYLAGELKRLCLRFGKNGIAALAFGGPLLAALAYRDASVPETKSLEFIVAREDIVQARDLLIADGYRREYTWDASREAAELRFRHVIGLDRSEDGVHVWLFTELDSGNYSRPMGLKSLPSSTVSLDGESVATLTAVDALLHACVHAAGDALSPHLSLISDAAGLAEKMEGDAWQEFLVRIRSLGVARKVFVILALARDLLGETFPEAVEAGIRRDPAVAGLCAHAIRCLFSDADYVPAMRKRIDVQLATRDGLFEKARFLAGLAATPTREDWSMAPLPASLYYALRPLRMLGRRAGLFRPRRFAVFMPTPREIVEEMLALAQVGPSDTIYDLGCGDGRMVICAAQRYGARGVGVDLDPDRVAEARANARAAGVDHLVSFVQQNVMEVDISAASVVTLFLSPQANLMLRPRLKETLPPHARVVSRSHDMGDWLPLKTKLVACEGAVSRIHLWRLEDEAKPQRLATH